MQMKSWNKKLKNRMIAGILAINTLASYGIASALSLAPETPESVTTKDIEKALNSSCGIKHTSGIGYDVVKRCINIVGEKNIVDSSDNISIPTIYTSDNIIDKAYIAMTGELGRGYAKYLSTKDYEDVLQYLAKDTTKIDDILNHGNESEKQAYAKS